MSAINIKKRISIATKFNLLTIFVILTTSAGISYFLIQNATSLLRNIKYYNLDVIISVGYRVKSKRGTQFRIWANKVLKEYLIKGYALNERKLKEQTEKLKELESTIEVFSKIAESYQLKQDEFSGILKVIKDYTYALDVLDKYDNKDLTVTNTNRQLSFRITYGTAKKIITKMKEKFGGSTLFGKEKDKSLKGTIVAIYQTFGKKELHRRPEGAGGAG